MATTDKFLDKQGLTHLWDKLNKKNTLGIEFITGTQTAATNTWTGVTKQSALYDGMKIAYQLPYAGNSNNATLNLTLPNGTTTGAKNIRRAGTGGVTTHYGAGTVVYMVYRTSVVISGTTYTQTWFCGEDYDSINVYQDYVIYSLSSSGSNGLKQYSIALRKSDGTLESCTTTDGTGTSKTVNTSGFLLDEMYWYNAVNVAANTAVANYTLYRDNGNVIDYRYTLNCGTTLTANKPIYLVGTIQDGLFYLSSPTYWAQDLPTTEDGKVYVLLGRAYDTHRGTFFENHPIYEYRNSAIHEFVDLASWAKSSTKPSYTYSEVGAAASSHTHGNITNAGALQTSDITIANGDKLVVTDASNSNKVARTSVSFDASTTTTALTPKGTFETFLQSHQDIKTLKTDNTAAQSTSSSESIAGTGTINLHKIAKTGTFADLVSKPTTISGYGITDALTIGTTATTAAAGNHTHTTTLATDTGTSSITLASAGKYKLTAGGTSVIFTMPTIPTDTDTWRGIQVNGTDLLGTATTTGKLNLKSGTNVTVSGSGNDVTITATNTDTKVNVVKDETNKAYILATTTTPTITATGVTATGNTKVYVQANTLYSQNKAVLVGGSNAASAVTISPKTTSVATVTASGSVTAGTATTPAVIDTSKFSGGSYSHSGFSGGSFTRGTFSQGTLPTLTMSINGTDSGQLDITFGQGTLPTHAADSFTAATYGTDTFTAASLGSGFYTAGTKGTPTAVTLPTFGSATVWNGYNTGVSNTYAEAQTFTGATS